MAKKSLSGIREFMSKALSNLDKASAWLKSFANPDHVSHIGLSNEIPNLYFPDFRQFQAAFAGKEASIHVGHYSTKYYVHENGLEFWSTQFVQQQSQNWFPSKGVVPHLSS